jgi:hypothetical protein
MAFVVTHATVAVGQETGDGEIGKAEWNEAHTVQGSYETPADVEAATISAGVLALRTDGYTSVGDGGHGFYKRMSAAPSDPTNAAYLRSVDRYTSAEVEDATHGGYWQLVPQGGAVWIEQFGGAGDANPVSGAGGTDNWQPLTDALAFIAFTYGTLPGASYTNTIQFSAGSYRFSDGFDLHQPVHITGVSGTGQTQNSTLWHFPGTVDPIIFGALNTSGATDLDAGPYTAYPKGSSSGAVLENVTIWGGGGDGILTNDARTMIRMRSQATIRNVALFGIPGRGIYIIGGGGDGNANNWHCENVYIHEAGSDYFKVQGSDANGGYCIGLVTHGEGGRGGCGIIETGGLGCNVYTGLQLTGYGNTGVRHDVGGGTFHLFQLIDATPDIGAATTPGTDDTVWMYMAPLAGETLVQFPVWSALDTYTLQLPVFIEAGQSVLIGTYCEGATLSSHIPGGAQVIGGNLSVTRYSNKLGQIDSGENSKYANTQAIGMRRAHAPGSAEETAHGEYTEVYVGGYNESVGFGATGGANLLQHRREGDGGASWYMWGYRGADLYYGLSGTADFWRFSGYNTAVTFGRSAAVPHVFGLHDFAIHDASEPTVHARIYGIRAARPSTGSHARGEWVWPQNPTTWGTAAWICTVTGTPGTWGQVPLWGLTSIDPALPGDTVQENTSDTRLKIKHQGQDTTVRHIDLGLSTTGEVTSKPATAPAAGGTFFFGASSTAGLGFYFGTGDPTISAGKGSIYSRTDATTTTTRLWVNTDGGTTWTNTTTAA